MSAEEALSQFFVHNFCPLLFLKESGCNLTPDELKVSQYVSKMHMLFQIKLIKSIVFCIITDMSLNLEK